MVCGVFGVVGGATTFTATGLKVVPRENDLLLFSHRCNFLPHIQVHERFHSCACCCCVCALLRLFYAGAIRPSDSDTGNTSPLVEHSGCPVRKGGKWVATQWYRVGVSEDEPWNTFENWGM